MINSTSICKAYMVKMCNISSITILLGKKKLWQVMPVIDRV